MNVMELKAGPELDALIAEKVMGLTIRWDWPDDEHHSDEKVRRVEIERDCVDGKKRMIDEELPRYSTDISAAWEVMEKIKDTHDIRLDSYPEHGWIVTVCPRRDVGGATAQEVGPAPHTICLTALKVVGVA